MSCAVIKYLRQIPQLIKTSNEKNLFPKIEALLVVVSPANSDDGEKISKYYLALINYTNPAVTNHFTSCNFFSI